MTDQNENSASTTMVTQVDTQRDATNPSLLEILVCPITKQPLRYDKKANELISTKANLAFPIRNGIPIMLIEEARELSDD